MKRKNFPALILLLVSTLLLSSTSLAAPFAYISNYGSGTVSVIDTATNTVTATIPVGASPYGLAVNPVGTRVYVANLGSSTVSVIDAISNTVAATVGVGASPVRVAVNPVGTRVYVVNNGSNTVSVIDAATNTVTASIPVGLSPSGIQVDPTGTKAYVANAAANTVSVIDTSTNTVTATVTLTGSSPIDLAVTPDGSKLYVTNHFSSNVSVIDTATKLETTKISAGTNPTGVWVNPAGTKVFVTHYGSGNVLVIDPSTDGVTNTLTGFSSPVSIEATPDGTMLYVVNQGGNTVSVLNATDYSLLASVPVGSTPLSYNGNFIAAPPAVTDGLFSLWRGEGNAFDVVGSNHGALHGGTVFALGEVGQAFSFDGTDDYAEIPNSDNLNFAANQPMSLNLWVKRTSTWPVSTILAKRPDCGGQVHYILQWYETGNWFHFGSSGGLDNGVHTTADKLPLNTWTFVSITFDGAIATMYINGTPVASHAMSFDPNTVPLTLGAEPVCGDYFGGLIDEVAFYNRALSAKEVLRLADPNGPLSWWRAEENASDSIGNNDGTLHGNATFADGRIGRAFSFDGSYSYVTVPNSSSIDYGATRTFEMWIYPKVTAGFRGLLAKGYNNYSHIFSLLNGHLALYDGGTWRAGTSVLSPNTWYHVAFVQNGSTVTMYLNGVLDGTADVSWMSTGDFLEIGSFNHSNFNDTFVGLIDEVKIFNRALSASEVGKLSGQVPDSFGFTPQSGLALNTVIESNSITVTGITQPAAISISGGEYAVSIDGGTTWGSWTSGTGTVGVNYRVKVRLTSASLFATPASTTLTIGGVNGVFSVTTLIPPADNWSAFTATEYGGGDGSAGNPYLIATDGQLSRLSADAAGNPASTAGKYYALTADIDLALHQWTPIPEFRGTFDGRSHRILNLTIDNIAADYQGLFGQINSGAAISNVGIINSSIIGNTLNGALAGYADTVTVTSCYSTGSLNGLGDGGGLIGGASATAVSGSWSSCNVTARAGDDRAHSGGLIGPVGGVLTISNSYATGTVIGAQNSGGLVGLNYSGNLTITNCFITGNVITSTANWNNVGGIVGLAGPGSSTTITNSYHSGTVSGSDGYGKTGGIIGGRDGGSSVNVTNSYYNSANPAGQGGGSAMTISEMRAVGFVGTLNAGQSPAPWLADTGKSNGGFPILAGMPVIFSFISQTGVQLDTPVDSNPITLNFIAGSASISISGGEYSVSSNNGIDWTPYSTSTPSTVSLNDQVRVHLTSSDSYSTTTTSTLTIGGVSGAFSVTTIPEPVDGACGASHGGTFTGAPSDGLCSAGTPSTVTGTGPWSWSCGGLNDGGNASCQANIRTYSVHFESGGHGTITGTASQTVNHGSFATAVTAVPAAGYHFVNWTGDNGFIATISNPLTVGNVTSVMTITANFAVNTIVINGGASTTASPKVTIGLHYTASQMRFLVDTAAAWTTWEPYKPTKALTLPTAGGMKTSSVCFKDAQGNLSPIFTATIFLDTAPPVGAISINDGAAVTTRTAVTLNLSVSDTNGEGLQMRFGENGSSWTAWYNFAGTWEYTLGTTPTAVVKPGVRKVYVQFKDAGGKVSSSLFDTITYQAIAPAGAAGGITINNDVPFTTKTGVTLQLILPVGMDRVRLGSNGTAWGGWLKIASPMNWTLPAGDGVKTVFAQYAAATDLGKPSETYSATIILDTVAPSGWVLIDGGAPVTGDRAVALTIGASDINGVATMCVKETANACVDSDFEEFAASKPYTITSVNDGVKNVYVSFRDNAGKKSIPCKASITLDTTAPGGAVVINGGQATTTSVNVTLKLTASKAVTMRISVDDGVTWGEWEPFAAARAATLPAGAGMKTVRVRYRDLAGNESGVISDTIELK